MRKEEKRTKRLFTSEHVSPGHPDKICDQISDAILDAHYSENPSTDTRVAVETLVKGNTVVVAGEVKSESDLDYKKIVAGTLESIGYTKDVSEEFNSDGFDFIQLVSGQSPDIDTCVSKKETGAGDQGIMFGYAVNEAPDFTGWAHYIARNIVSEIWKLKQANDSTGMHSICPDYKVQVTMDYSAVFPKVDTVLVSVSHTPDTDMPVLTDALRSVVRATISEIEKESEKRWSSYDSCCASEKLDASDYKVLVNPYGPFTVFGPVADSGLTGRKIVCDQYGGYAPVGGGAFSGKDLTKVDRTAAYMARYVAKNILNLCRYRSDRLPDHLVGWLDVFGPLKDCSVETAYIIGCAEPVSVNITLRTHNGKETFLDGETLSPIFGEDLYDMFKPDRIIERLKLFAVDYSEVAKFGHIGCDTIGVWKPWECLNI